MTTRIVSASAGSGKTHRIAEELKDALGREAPRVLPENVLATTFTNRAAAELQERARRYLLEQGRTTDAQRLAAARIGTVNSVCGRLVSDFAFELGLPPEQRVLDEQAASVALRQALSAVITVEETLEIAELQDRFAYFEVLEAVRKVIELARANRIDPATFAACAVRSRDELTTLLNPPSPSGEAFDAALLGALESFDAEVDPLYDPTGATAEALERVAKALGRLRASRPLRWDDWAALARVKTGAKSRGAVAPVHAAAAHYLDHPGFRSDLERTIALVFELARRGLLIYEQQKRAAGVLDFVDQETQALHLLERQDIRERLRGELDLVFVDEFQDTSPLQLAIFLRLAELVPSSLWVGDQKQSIFGFRGSDPELMEAVIDVLAVETGLETLPRSWRSRPELIRLTSEIFARAFAGHGVPENRVRLEPAPHLETEPAGLGPIVERWRLTAKNQDEDPIALAAALCQLLSDPTVRVRDRALGGARPVQSSDVAILCRRNSMARSVAQALANASIPAVVPRSGLLATAEGQLALLGLRLWADPGDAFAAAAIARLADFPADGESWLVAALESPRAQTFFALPRVQSLLVRRQEVLHAGPTEALAAVLDAMGVRGLCADWGETPQRLANLDALRSLAVVYGEASLAAGSGATVAGLVTHLESLRKERLDSQATLSAGAVMVSTWHAAKGLEWPIVVLFQLDAEHDPSIFGISVEREDQPFEMGRPLEGRWLRLWPLIFHPSRRLTEFHERLGKHETAARMKQRRDAEELRLLYVGWTRARDRVILAGRKTRLLEGILRHLKDGAGNCLVDDAEDGCSCWGGRNVEVLQRAADATAPEPPISAAGEIDHAAGPVAHPPAWAQPSATSGVGALGPVETLGERLQPRGSWDENQLGEAFHRFFAADDPALVPLERLRCAQELVAAWSVAANVTPAELVAAADRLWRWIESRWPGSRRWREVPLQVRLEGGTVLRGSVDLVVETPTELVIVDHKSAGGLVIKDVESLACFAGQVRAYAGGLQRAWGKECRQAFLHLPLSGSLVAVGELTPLNGPAGSELTTNPVGNARSG